MTTRRKFLRNSALGAAVMATLPTTVIARPANNAQTQENSNLQVGIAREIITPPLGGLIAGYGSNQPSTEIHDELTVTALTLEYGNNKVLLMSAAVCLINNALTAQLRALCGEAAGIPATNVILAVTHTHSGPVLNTEYCDNIFIPKCVAVAKASVQNLKPAKVGIGTTDSRVGINRRKLLPNDRVILSQNPWGALDPEMTVISFKDENGKTFANIVHYAAHPTAIGIGTILSGDWPSVMVDRLDAETGGITMFVQGMLGDIGPRLTNGEDKGDIKLMRELGAIAAADAVRAYKDIRVFRDEDMSIVIGDVRLPHAPIMPLAEARAELARLDTVPSGRWTAGIRDNLTRIIDLHERGETGESFFTYHQTIVKIGPIVLIPVPFEVSCEVSLRLRAYSKYGHTLALGCTNGSNSYIVSKDQIARGGYEVDMFLAIGPRQLTHNADMHLINQNLALIDRL